MSPFGAAATVAAGEVALALGLRREAEERARLALSVDPGNARAGALLLAALEFGIDGDRRNRHSRRIPPAALARYRRSTAGELTSAEAETLVAATIRHGRRRTRLPRRLGGSALPPGTIVAVHSARPDIGVLVRDHRVVDVVVRR